MKKTLLFIATVVSLISCEHNYTENNKLTDKGRIIHASTYDATRIYLEKDENVYAHKWSSADILGVFDKTTAVSQYMLIEGEDTTDGSFLQVTIPDEGKSLNKSYAVYPYSENNIVSADGVFNVSFSAEQIYNTQHPHSYGLGSNILVGIGENDNFNFKNACGFLEINLTGSTRVHKITLVGNNNEKIAGAGIVSYSGDNEPKAVMLPSSTTEVSIISEDGVLLDPTIATPFVFALPPTEFKNGFTIKIQGCGEISTQRCINVQRNIITPMATIDCGMPYNEIWYINGNTTSSTSPYKTDAFGDAKVVSNIYDASKGCWVITFDKDLTEVGDRAFYEKLGIRKIYLPKSLTSIGAQAFYGCKNLTEITIPNNVVTIGDTAFYGCTNLSNINIPDSLIVISESCFGGCSSITDIVIGQGVTSIGQSAFYGCTALNSINIPDNVTTIENNAFDKCTSLTHITIGSGIESIGYDAFTCYNAKIFCTTSTPPAICVKKDANYNVYGSFGYKSRNIQIYVPLDSYASYTQYTQYKLDTTQQSNWALYNDQIIAYDFENDVIVE